MIQVLCILRSLFQIFVSNCRFAKDEVNFSISTDDPTIVGKDLQENYDLLLNEMNFTEDMLMKCVSSIFK